MRRKFLIWSAFIFVAAAAVLGILYVNVIPGLSSARTEPPEAETILATWLLHQSVPLEAKMRVNPVSDPSDVAAGKDLYREKCETCHAYNGDGRTPIGSDEFPRVPTLRSPAIAATADGELFYHIRNGIRNTGMPAWNLPDRQIWQLVSYIRHLPGVAAMTPEAAAALSPAAPAGLPPDHGHYARIGCLQRMSRRGLRALEQDPDGQCGARSPRTSRRHHPRPFKVQSGL